MGAIEPGIRLAALQHNEGSIPPAETWHDLEGFENDRLWSLDSAGNYALLEYTADRATVLELLSESLATELVCVLRYRRHHFMGGRKSSSCQRSPVATPVEVATVVPSYTLSSAVRPVIVRPA